MMLEIGRTVKFGGEVDLMIRMVVSLRIDP